MLRRTYPGLRSALLLLATCALLLVGVPLFLALDHRMLLPPSLRDRPWPFELVALAGAAGLVGSARSALCNGRVVAMGCAIVGVLNAGVLPTFTLLSGLPPIPPELRTGAHSPAVTLLDQNGAPVDLARVDAPMLLVVFRGVWCPYCRKELSRLAVQIPRFSSANVRVYGISADPPEALLRHRSSQGLPLSMLSDPEQKATGLCGFSMHCLLLFDRKGVLRWGGFSESWRSPPRYEDVLQAAYRLQ